MDILNEILVVVNSLLDRVYPIALNGEVGVRIGFSKKSVLENGYSTIIFLGQHACDGFVRQVTPEACKLRSALPR